MRQMELADWERYKILERHLSHGARCHYVFDLDLSSWTSCFLMLVFSLVFFARLLRSSSLLSLVWPTDSSTTWPAYPAAHRGDGLQLQSPSIIHTAAVSYSAAYRGEAESRCELHGLEVSLRPHALHPRRENTHPANPRCRAVFREAVMAGSCHGQRSC